MLLRLLGVSLPPPGLDDSGASGRLVVRLARERIRFPDYGSHSWIRVQDSLRYTLYIVRRVRYRPSNFKDYSMEMTFTHITFPAQTPKAYGPACTRRTRGVLAVTGNVHVLDGRHAV